MRKCNGCGGTGVLKRKKPCPNCTGINKPMIPGVCFKCGNTRKVTVLVKHNRCGGTGKIS